MSITGQHDPGQDERLQDELTLLEAIYPEQVKWVMKNREVIYTNESGNASLALRLPDNYLVGGLPEVITTKAPGGELRHDMQAFIAELDPSMEQLDAIVDKFNELAYSASAVAESDTPAQADEVRDDKKATVVVWLHHLLNTNKRKQALSPSPEVSGFTKPGYPGILLYTGQASSVRAHVAELRSLNWQAFQVRLESSEHWPLPHSGVKEVESMGDIVSVLDESHKQEFLSAVMKL